MLISNNVSDDTGGGEDCVRPTNDLNPEYQTASELFELMTKNADFEANDNAALTTLDLVLLYKNIDIGTKLMNDATEMKSRKPNQYVETIICNDEPESESELSEICSTDDFQNICMINQERLDIFNNNSLENLLGHKFGSIEIKPSNLSMDYDKNFLFKDPYIKTQLINLNPMESSSKIDMFSTSLIDYICCKRLEDNYNFYMENIIRYVQHTIEQLKRISNGEYLTDRTKEKWREMNSNEQENNTKVLATSTSIPFHVECKRNGNATWDDIVHSEVDLRSLSKILEKKIVVEIPKLICGSYRLYSQQFADNLVISCQKEHQKHEKDGQESRVDVVLKLQKSHTGQVISNISSIMVLRTSPALQDLRPQNILSLSYNKEANDTNREYANYAQEHRAIVTELSNETDLGANHNTENTLNRTEQPIKYEDSDNGISLVETNCYPDSEFEFNADVVSNQQSSETSHDFKNLLMDATKYPELNETSYNMISPDDLRLAMRRLSLQKSTLNESNEDSTSYVSKKRSPIRVRVKSPYENKSFLMEEKKRKRLLEIRERREKKKIALSERCKISKHKYGKATMPQASSSVTKLSITNKSFYNSIYGQNIDTDNKLQKLERINRKGQKPTTEEIITEELHDDSCNSPSLEENNEKYINRNYYLDDTETEMMFTQMKINENTNVHHSSLTSNSVESTELNTNFGLLSDLISAPDTNFTKEPISGDVSPPVVRVFCEKTSIELSNPVITAADENVQHASKKKPSDECRKSIDQLYDLIKKFGKPSVSSNVKTCKSKVATNFNVRDGAAGDSTIQGTDSGTSVKHHENATLSDHTGFSTDKNKINIVSNNRNESVVIPKVIISSKLQSHKVEPDKTKKDRKRVTLNPPPKGVSDNPLKAISQLLHEFDNVQKTMNRHQNDAKQPKKTENSPNDLKTTSRQSPNNRQRSRLEQHLKGNDMGKKGTHNTQKDKPMRPVPPLELARIPHQISTGDKYFDKRPKKRIADIIDEAKEARGEAVRGPSKLNSRLNSLAQPKKSYVQARHEEYQTRYGRNLLADRLQRLASTPTSPPERNLTSPTAKNRGRKSRGDPPTDLKQQFPAASHLDKGRKPKSPRRSASSSPSYKRTAPIAPGAIKKMVAVESYVKSHYGRCASPTSANGKSRIPLVPLDLELASSTSSPVIEEANELGYKLHRMVDSVLTSAPAVTLSALTECEESVSRDQRVDDSLPCAPRTESDYNINNLEDKDLTTAVESVYRNTTEDFPVDSNTSNSNLKLLNSVTELEKLEHALYTHISGAFQKKLRIKNLTLTPKHSIQQSYLVQSGDVGSLLVKSVVSNIKIHKCSFHDLKMVTPVLSNSHLDWAFTQIPMQIATVGYVFPDYHQASTNMVGSKAKFLEVANVVNGSNSVEEPSKSDKVSQVITASQQKEFLEVGAQVDVIEKAAELTMSVGSQKNISEKSSENIVNKKLKDSENIKEVAFTDVSYNNKAVFENDNDGDNNKEIQLNNLSPSLSPDCINYTTSLDMLVGLLNEIQKISCQNQMTTAENTQNYADLESIAINDTNLETKDKNASRDLISLTCLNNLRQLESSASTFSYNVSIDSNATGNSFKHDLVDKSNIKDGITDIWHSKNKTTIDENIMTEESKPNSADKEVSANICEDSENKYVSTFTDITSSLNPLVINTVDFSDPAIGVNRKTSTKSVVSNEDFYNLYSNNLLRSTMCSDPPTIKNIIEISEIDLKKESTLISSNNIDLSKNIDNKTFTHNNSIKAVKNKKFIKNISKYNAKNIDTDPMLKIKRDILVTVYSILVLTVFAALSFPQVLMIQ